MKNLLQELGPYLLPEEQAELAIYHQAIDVLDSKDSLYSFAKAAWHVVEPNEPFIDGWHIRVICEHLEACARGKIRNLIINMPPRHMKSLLVSVLFPAWVWVNYPGKRFLFASYSQSLSTRDAVKMRRLVTSSWYHDTFKVEWDLSDDQRSKNRFDNEKGGYRISTSTEGGATGDGGDFVVVDDPSNAKDISQNALQTVRDWWDGTMSSRAMNPKTVVKIIVMQRLAEGDLSGHLISKGGWTHLCLPARCDGEERKPTDIGWVDPRQKGELLWPNHFGEPEILALEKDMGPRISAGQLGQRPSPAGGAVWRREDFRFYKELPIGLEVIVHSWDLTFKDTEKGAYNVGQVWGRKGPDFFLIAQVRRRMEFTEQCEAIFQMTLDYPNGLTRIIEDAANAQASISVLKTKIPGLIAIRPEGSKLDRAESVAGLIKAGNVYLPDTSIQPWVETEFLYEVVLFPNGNNKDQVDAASQALSYLSKNMHFDCAPESMTQTSKWIGRR